MALRAGSSGHQHFGPRLLRLHICASPNQTKIVQICFTNLNAYVSGQAFRPRDSQNLDVDNEYERRSGQKRSRRNLNEDDGVKKNLVAEFWDKISKLHEDSHESKEEPLFYKKLNEVYASLSGKGSDRKKATNAAITSSIVGGRTEQPKDGQRREYSTSHKVFKEETVSGGLNAGSVANAEEREIELYDCDQSLTIRFMGALGGFNALFWTQYIVTSYLFSVSCYHSFLPFYLVESC